MNIHVIRPSVELACRIIEHECDLSRVQAHLYRLGGSPHAVEAVLREYIRVIALQVVFFPLSIEPNEAAKAARELHAIEGDSFHEACEHLRRQFNKLRRNKCGQLPQIYEPSFVLARSRYLYELHFTEPYEKPGMWIPRRVLGRCVREYP